MGHVSANYFSQIDLFSFFSRISYIWMLYWDTKVIITYSYFQQVTPASYRSIHNASVVDRDPSDPKLFGQVNFMHLISLCLILPYTKTSNLNAISFEIILYWSLLLCAMHREWNSIEVQDMTYLFSPIEGWLDCEQDTIPDCVYTE